MIYLDNAATTYPKPENVYKQMDLVNRNLCFNAGRGSYKKAREATELIDTTKKQLLSLVNSPSSSVAFTPSLTIALNEIIKGIDLRDGANVYVSPYEHNAVARVCNLLPESITVTQLPVCDDTLEIDIEKTKYIFSKHRPSLVCCTHVSNVTGYILPVQEIFSLAKDYDATTVLDTAQSLGLVPVDQQQFLSDFIAFAGHKTLYGPFGIGGMIISPKAPKLNVVVAGGTGSSSLNLNMPENVPARYESSSSNIVAIAGLKAALEELNQAKNYLRERELTLLLKEKLTSIPGIKLYCPPESSHIGVVSFNVEGFSADDVGMILDQDFDIAVRTGNHCAPYIHKLLSDDSYVGTVRVSVSAFNKEEDINALVDALNDITQ